MNRWSWSIMAVLVLCGCSAARENGQTQDDPAIAAISSAASIRQRTNADPSTAMGQRLLGDGEKRLSLLVLPGDVLVEIDSVPARRRNGLVELIGKVGDERRIEVFLDAATKVEKIVKIDAAGLSPPLIDAEAETVVNAGPVKTPVVFDVNE